MTDPVHEVLAAAARESRSRIIALLASASGDVELAEDAVATAFERALDRWPETGIPDNPDAWLLTVARNHQRDVWKSPAYRRRAAFDENRFACEADESTGDSVGGATDPSGPTDPAGPADSTGLAVPADSAGLAGSVGGVNEMPDDEIEDRRLALLFVCAHPAIDPAARTPLMLQVVLGFEAKDIARAFALPPATMAQRLVRAKRRIRDARIPFVIPTRADISDGTDISDGSAARASPTTPDRLAAVLEAVYGCLAIAWAESPDIDLAESMGGEALFLARLLTRLLPDEPEVHGLASLIAFSLSRAPARRGDYVPVEEQDPAEWDAGLIAEGERHLRRALAFERPGRFTLEAAMQAVHADRARTGRTDWPALRVLVDALLVIAPSLGAKVARAAIVVRTEGPQTALVFLDEIAEDRAASRFQPYLATLAEALRRAGRSVEAADAYEKAIALAPDARTATWLRRRAASV